MAAYFADGLFIKQIVSCIWGFLFPSQWDSVTAATGVDGMEVEQSSFRCLFVSKYA